MCIRDSPYFGFDIQSENNENSTFINWTDGKDFYLYTTDYGKVTLAQDPATSLTTEIKSLDIPLNTTKELTDVTFLLNGKETINATYYAMNITFEPEGILSLIHILIIQIILQKSFYNNGIRAGSTQKCCSLKCSDTCFHRKVLGVKHDAREQRFRLTAQ